MENANPVTPVVTLTQNDVLEFLVSERLEQISLRYQALEAIEKEIKTATESLIRSTVKKFCDDFRKNHKLNLNLIKKPIKLLETYDKKMSHVELSLLDFENVKKYHKSTKCFAIGVATELEFITEDKQLVIKPAKNIVEIPFNNKLMNLQKKYSKEVDNFFIDFGTDGVILADEVRVLKAIKFNLNKQLLKDTSEQYKATLQLNFNGSL